MFIWQYEGGQLIKSNYKPEYPVGGGGVIVLWSVWPLFALYFMVMHSQVKMKLTEVVNGVKCQINYLFYQYAGQMSI